MGKGEIARYEQFLVFLLFFFFFKRALLQTLRNQGLFGKGLDKKRWFGKRLCELKVAMLDGEKGFTFNTLQNETNNLAEIENICRRQIKCNLEHERFSKQAFIFTCLLNKSEENIVGKGEIARATSNFSFSHSVFYLFGNLSDIFTIFMIVVCKLFQFGRG